MSGLTPEMKTIIDDFGNHINALYAKKDMDSVIEDASTMMVAGMSIVKTLSGQSAAAALVVESLLELASREWAFTREHNKSKKKAA